MKRFIILFMLGFLLFFMIIGKNSVFAEVSSNNMQNFVNPYSIPIQNTYTPRTSEERAALLGFSTGTNKGTAYKDDAALAEALRGQLKAKPAQSKPLSNNLPKRSIFKIEYLKIEY